jgi:alginate O-acetyltransferase complex protein AlgI
MLFHTVEFFWFMAALLLLVLALPRFMTMWILLVASYVFYGWSGPWFVLVLMTSSTVDFLLARHFGARPRFWKLGIVVSAIVNFSLLGFFKYSGFAFTNVNWALQTAGLPGSLPILHVILPVGISFYTFQSFAYIVDVLTGRIPAERSYPRFLLFVGWFPQLVAGPINRAAALMPQVETIESRIAGMASRVPMAAALFAEGWLRKACADLVSPTSDAFFANPAAATGAGALWGILAFGVQIYADFSGYTKMAQGTSWIFGIRLMENFNLPYAAASVREFWRRWHISLSTWFRDYLYIPLGGNRRAPARNYFNLIFTMLVCGMWHGANWTFLLWGALHGTLLIAERVFARAGAWIPRPLGHALTLAFVFLAWVPFRAPDLAATGASYAALAHGGWEWPPLAFILGALVLLGTDAYYKYSSRRAYDETCDEARAMKAVGEWKAATLVAACALMWSAQHILGQNKVASFIYFQF